LLEKLLMGVNLRVDVPLSPGAIVREVGETLSEKSAGTEVKLATFDQGPFWPADAKACTSQK
jgi:hypothetical protein